MKKKQPKEVSAYFSKLGKKSWAARVKKLKANGLLTVGKVEDKH